MKKIISPIIFLVFGIALGLIIPKLIQSNQAQGHALRAVDPRYPLINPLLACSSFEAILQNGVDSPLRTRVNNLVDRIISDGQADNLSIYFRDLNGGEWFAIGEKEKYDPASLLKVPTMIGYLKASESNQDLLSKKILYDGSFDSNNLQGYKPTHTLIAGERYSISELLRRLIAYSDNNASILLHNNINADKLGEIFTDIGAPIPEHPGYYMTVGMYSYFFRILYNATYLSKSYSEQALDYLSQSDFPDGFRAVIATSTVIAEKFGERVSTSSPGGLVLHELHDCGIIYHPGKPYLLCVMSRGADAGDLARDIQAITRLVDSDVSSGK